MTERERLARVASHSITRHVEPCRDARGWWVLTAMLALAVTAGIMWVAEARDELRAVHRAVAEPCRR